MKELHLYSQGNGGMQTTWSKPLNVTEKCMKFLHLFNKMWPNWSHVGDP